MASDRSQKPFYHRIVSTIDATVTEDTVTKIQYTFRGQSVRCTFILCLVSSLSRFTLFELPIDVEN
jgi:hypothetical protein